MFNKLKSLISGSSQPRDERLVPTKKGGVSPDSHLFESGPNEGIHTTYTLRMTQQGANTRAFGTNWSKRPMKTLLVMGSTGAGKTTLINAIVNYVLGVRYNDQHRFIMIPKESAMGQAHSQTSEVTAYVLYYQNGFRVEFSLTILDTPGFGDTRGIDQDRQIVKDIKDIFSDTRGVVDSIDAVCFVAQASLARLTASQRYVFESILSIFGRDMADNIIIMATFADGKKPQVLNAIKEADIPCVRDEKGEPLHLKFNNSAMFSYDDDNNHAFNQSFWDMGERSMGMLFSKVSTMPPKSLKLTRDVLKHRERLEALLAGLMILVNQDIAKLDDIAQQQKIFRDNEDEINRTSNYHYEVDETEWVKESVSAVTTFCSKCNFTCHMPCGIPNTADKKNCCAMDSNGMCEVCPAKCVWSVHYNADFKMVAVTKKVKKTYADLKAEHEKKCGQKLNLEQVLKRMRLEYEELSKKLSGHIDEVVKTYKHLCEIALRPDPVSTVDYIDQMIEAEKREAKGDWKRRVNILEEQKKTAEMLQRYLRRQ